MAFTSISCPGGSFHSRSEVIFSQYLRSPRGNSPLGFASKGVCLEVEAVLCQGPSYSDLGLLMAGVVDSYL